VAEIGAGMGALTVALAEAGATEVLAIEFDRALIPALRETTSAWPAVRVEQADATRIDWTATLGAGPWVCCANLPYNVGTSIVLDVVALAEVDPIVVMVQREVAERLAAGPGSPAYGVDSVRVACRATARLIRDVPPEVFWPQPHVGSAVVRFDRLASPVGGAEMGRVVDAAFAHRRKTIRLAVRRLAPDPADAERVLAAAAVDPSSRPEQLGVAQFAAIAEALG
jgi:16S rRNA (adenine1518-N6/adenine1519-N6)-dimethyltransferase